MLPLALNTVLSQSMRAKYQLAIGALPLSVAFASFWPLFYFGSWLEKILGIPANSPVKAHPNGGLWLAIFLSVMVFGMVVGYALGWLLDAAIAHYGLGWPASKVKAVFWRSHVPAHWLKGPSVSGRPASTVVTSMAKWEEQRKRGLLRYVLTRGVVAWGAPMFAVMYLAPMLTRGHPFSLASLAFNAALWVCAGASFGAIVWYFSETNYRRYKASREV